MNILIVGHDTFENKGCQALIYSTTRILKDTFKNTRFKIFSWDPEYDAARFDQPGIDCEFIQHKFNVNEFSIRNRFWLFLNIVLKIRTDKGLNAPQYFYDAIRWADLVVVSGGDILADYGEDAVKHYFFPIAVSIALEKPVYVFAQSISPYSDLNLKKFCKQYLDKVKLITVREQLSYDNMKDMGVKAPVRLVADPAFTLNPCSQERVKSIVKKEKLKIDGKLLIGFSVSLTVTRWGDGDQEKFISNAAEAIDVMAKKYPEASFLFVPHVTYRNDSENDDRVAGRDVFEKVSHKERVYLVEGDYNCEESKGIIGLCDIFVGARTHATIASTSQLVPTIALAYSTKAYGIMEKILDRERCVLPINEFNSDRLVSMVDTLISEKDQVVSLMRERMPAIRMASLENGELAKKIIGFN